jgi:hypothetical protein
LRSATSDTDEQSESSGKEAFCPPREGAAKFNCDEECDATSNFDFRGNVWKKKKLMATTAESRRKAALTAGNFIAIKLANTRAIANPASKHAHFRAGLIRA